MKKIIVLHRGWIVVGNVFTSQDEVLVEGGHVIRRWGTTEGLGELALKGPLPETKLDKIPTLRVHKLGVVLTLDCAQDRWMNV